MPLPLLLALFGTYQIGYAVNDWQSWYMEYVFTGSSMDVSEDKIDDDMLLHQDSNYSVYEAEDGVRHYVFYNVKSARTPGEAIGYGLLSFFQVFLTTLWVSICLFTGGYIYYKREMEKSIHLLLNSADKIADNCLDFSMEKTRSNELGMVCEAFEKMRLSLQKTSQENFRLLEERRRLNAAFAHDMRNPITVLKGYTDLLERYVPKQRISREKEMEIVGMMHGQIRRLENYVQKMSEVQKLEDIVPIYNNVRYENFISLCTETARQLDGRVIVRTEETGGGSGTGEMEERLSGAVMNIDKELVLEVMENLLANASVYTKDKIVLTIANRGTTLELRVADNGNGFSEEALQMAGSPFYRDGNKKNREHSDGHSDIRVDDHTGSHIDGHFGLGLYICKLICEKCGGGLRIENAPDGSGGVATAVFALRETNIPA